jgi:hypothetical protein
LSLSEKSQNTSPAVMQQRASPLGLDYFPTPPWATRALCQWLLSRNHFWDDEIVIDPAAGGGHMATVLREYFGVVVESDVVQYPGTSYGLGDFTDPEYCGFLSLQRPAWVITNPPFTLAEQFVFNALRITHGGVALLVRTAFLEGVKRHENIFSCVPPTHVLQFAERVPMHQGRLDPKGSTATAYCWAVWIKTEMAYRSTRLEWLAPCRKRLERDGDYPQAGI